MENKEFNNFLSAIAHILRADGIAKEKMNDKEYGKMYDGYAQRYNELMKLIYENEEVRNKIIELNSYHHQWRFWANEYYYKIGFKDCLEVFHCNDIDQTTFNNYTFHQSIN